jgi:hypothetical protein
MKSLSRPLAPLVALVVLAWGGSPPSEPLRPQPSAPHLRMRPGVRLGHPPREALVNANGSLRVTNASDYEAFWRIVAPALEAWAKDPRLGIDPNYLAALLIKESGADSLAVSPAAALGLAQLTARTDADLRLMASDDHFRWMRAELDTWPRAGVVHDSGATAAVIDSLLAHRALGSWNEYLFNPRSSARAAAFWVRLLENKWTTDLWPGGYGTFARRRLNHGHPLDESQLFDLVTVSYNRGYLAVHDLVERYGRAWTGHLDDLGAAGAEASDYLDRVRTYVARFAAAPAAMSR